ncbi:polyribonucleotide nucleotidyltransferase [Balneicella halophila]|uniref:Polyribonucleotide nucleotidyltransferase n=1 Tax=Balneicella halophila TaxID=1537566 RepID=A0A7L4UNP7_BALHA|nr:polyribonucleotide nucleotidyltransferase [Balneicella halophila]PVX50813.1 polyribonucleotide nucleotidyltransferase [Balneicella halophila]
MLNVVNKTIDLGDGRSITLETGKLAKQADGSVMLKMGDTMLLATIVSAKEARPDVDFMPLSVDYKEKFAALGRFPGGFLKREGRPSDYEILIARLIDRALRPLFPEDYHAETFVNVTLFSADEDTQPDALAGLAASAAIAVSDVPFAAPMSEVRVARIDGKLVLNPPFSAMEKADMDIIVAATEDNIMMVEGEMQEVSEQEMLEAIKFAHEAIKKQCRAQIELAEAVGKTQKREYNHENNDEELKAKVQAETYDKAYEVARQANADKHLRSELFHQVEEDFKAQFEEEDEQRDALIKKYFHDVMKDAVRNMMLAEEIRLDGRKMDEIRPIWSEVDYLPGTHGSAIFTRGETQSLTTVTLGTSMDEKRRDDVLIQDNEKFVLHYNFPAFSTGDARPNRGVSRREVGHGNLAFRALKTMIPEEIPYAVRVVSEILESNGSSSMATVCAGTLALMDAGVQMKKPVSGIAMGLVTDSKSGKYVVLSDILGDEDHLGDMDFKVTGTRDGITATQMDIKVDGLSYEVLEKALLQAKEGRLHILDKLAETLAEPRDDYKPNAPRIVAIEIPKDAIGAVIGPGGKVVQEIQAETGAVVVIREEDDHGVVEIAATDKATIEAATKRVRDAAGILEVGKVYNGKVRSIMKYGAFVEIMPRKDGLLHISEIAHERVTNVEDYLKEGQMIDVKLIGIEENTGKLKLSRKVLLDKPDNKNKEKSEEK